MPSSPAPYYPSQCQTCEFYTHNPHLRCTLHPFGLASEECLDFVAIALEGEGLGTAQASDAEEQWQPEGAAYYNGELVLQTRRRTLTEQLELLDTHPLFTGWCPNCEMPIGSTHPVQVHWDCLNCGWLDDSV
ncbi:hypothetical protein NDI45_26420 [Leptolyngbya sp. GB1-A1]|uniref:hypothetical protein n=1 Tax=Leptolyngbya sp. GB1-A1 TaxID=2933908 RepID=UPI0032980874